MNTLSSAAKLLESMHVELKGDFDRMLAGVAEAVDKAPDGAWINASEEKVRDLFAEFRRKTYETALQLKIAAAEAAFSPSARSGDPEE